MFLIRAFILSCLFLLALPVFAAKSTPLELGSYTVEKGPGDFCMPFKLSEIPKKDDVPVYLGPLHSFYLKEQKHKSTSDITPSCVFIEDVKRKDKKNETVITVTNKEECKGKTVSVTTNRFTIKSDSIRLEVVEKGASGYSCSWSRKSNQ